MSGEHLDWSVAGYASHPVPGDPDAVRAAAHAFAATHERLEAAAQALATVDDDTMQAETLAKLRVQARELQGQLLLAAARYAEAGPALTTYSAALARAQQQAEDALRSAASARQAHQSHAQRQQQMFDGAKTAAEPEQREQYLTAYHRARSDAEDAASSYHAAKRLIEDAIADRDSAANAAADRIGMAISTSQLNDTFLDKAGEFFDNLVKLGADLMKAFPALKAIVVAIQAAVTWVWENIEDISLVLSLLALVAGWVPVVGQVIAALALVVKVIVAIKVVVTVGQAIAANDWRGAGVAAISGLMGLVAGKLLAKGAQALGKKVVQQVARSGATSSATGYRAANSALKGVEPNIKSGNVPKVNGARMGDSYYRLDAMIREGVPGATGQAAQDSLFILRVTDDPRLHDALGDGLVGVAEDHGVPDHVVSLVEQAIDAHADSGSHRIMTAPGAGVVP